MKIKALSVSPVEACTILNVGQDVLNRGWKTRFRGWVLLYADRSQKNLTVGVIDPPIPWIRVGQVIPSGGCGIRVKDEDGRQIGETVSVEGIALFEAFCERAKQLGASAPSVGSYHQPDLKSTLDALQKLNPEYVRLTADVPVKRFQPCVEFIIDQIRHCEVINYECHEANIPGTPVVRSIGLTAQIGTCAVIGYKMLNYASNRWWVDSTTIEGPNVKTKWRIPHIYDSDIFNALAERYNEITDNTNKVEPVAPVFPKPWEE